MDLSNTGLNYATTQALIPPKNMANEAELKTLLIRELARRHRNDGMPDQKVFDLIQENYIDHHAYDWGKDPNTAGAFAFFRPQQFTHLWNHMIRPPGDVIIAAEAASPHHAWVVGALESVIHGLHAWMLEQLAAKILAEHKDGNPYVGLPPYMTDSMSRWYGLLANFE